MLSVQYIFNVPKQNSRHYTFNFEEEDMQLLLPKRNHYPDWTKLDTHKCEHCPLTNNESDTCPLAEGLLKPVSDFNSLSSIDEISVEVVTKERRVVKTTTAQKALSSLMGLIIPTSGCPHTRFFRPMARFHLPFASEEETLFRAAATYLLSQYFSSQKGQAFDHELTGLKEVYQDIHIVNHHIAERLRLACKEDSSVNALVILDLFTKSMPAVIDESLDELKYIFEPMLPK